MMENENTATGAGDAADSWANETLPMGMRRELLDREIQKYSSSRAGHGHAPPHGAQGSPPGGEHPRAGDNGERPD